jgi:hypothetical protein
MCLLRFPRLGNILLQCGHVAGRVRGRFDAGSPVAGESLGVRLRDGGVSSELLDDGLGSAGGDGESCGLS